ncbi:hypothetical protein PENTCL1PPCAC_15637, partial [Pristionchus entomophagus]
SQATIVLADSVSIDFENHFVVGFDYDVRFNFLTSAQRFVQIGHPFLPTDSLRALYAVGSILPVIFNHVKQNAFSASQSKLHHRILMLMAQQAIVPFCFVYSLGLICNLSLLIRVDISFMGPIFILTTSIPPLLSCFSVIWLTNEYRQM